MKDFGRDIAKRHQLRHQIPDGTGERRGMTQEELKNLFDELKTLSSETEWVEFKEAKNTFDFNKLGQYFSALSNEANLKRQPCGWMIFGVENNTRKIVGTHFRQNR